MAASPSVAPGLTSWMPGKALLRDGGQVWLIVGFWQEHRAAVAVQALVGVTTSMLKVAIPERLIAGTPWQPRD
jgi:hypothetical protein